MFFKINRYFYQNIKDLVENHNQPRFKLKHSFEIALITLYALRMAIHTYSLSNGGNTAPWWQYDYLAYYVQHNRRLYDDLIGPAIIIFCIFIIVSLKGLHFLPEHNVTWQMHYDFVVQTTD